MAHNPTDRYVLYRKADGMYFKGTRRPRRYGLKAGETSQLWTPEVGLAKVFLGKSAICHHIPPPLASHRAEYEYRPVTVALAFGAVPDSHADL